MANPLLPYAQAAGGFWLVMAIDRNRLRAESLPVCHTLADSLARQHQSPTIRSYAHSRTLLSAIQLVATARYVSCIDDHSTGFSTKFLSKCHSDD